jgi:hypothetical protein
MQGRAFTADVMAHLYDVQLRFDVAGSLLLSRIMVIYALTMIVQEHQSLC